MHGFDYKIVDKILIVKDDILCKAESPKRKEPWTITTVHTEWNNWGYTWNQIGTTKRPESRTFF